MNVLETEWWTMALPPEWWADTEEDSILIGDRDDVGCIEISTLHRDVGEFDEPTLRSIALADGEPDAVLDTVQLGEFSGLYCTYAEEGMAIRAWYVASGALMLYITYSCAADNRGMDDAAVDEILDTLLPLAPREND